MKAFNRKFYNRFYNLVESCVTLGRPCIVHGSRGSGKTYLLTDLRPNWKCKESIKSQESILYFQVPLMENPVSVFRSLVAQIAPDMPKISRASEVRVYFETALIASTIRLIIIDNAESAKSELYRLIWASLERVRANKHPVGLVLSCSEDRDLLSSLPDIAAKLPILGSFHMDALDAPNCLQALAHWAPAFKPLEYAIFGEDQDCEAFKSADYLASVIRRLTGGAMLELSDLAMYWKQKSPKRVPDIGGIEEIWTMRGRIFPLLPKENFTA